jgi:hypothetical protein
VKIKKKNLQIFPVFWEKSCQIAHKKEIKKKFTTF